MAKCQHSCDHTSCGKAVGAGWEPSHLIKVFILIALRHNEGWQLHIPYKPL